MSRINRRELLRLGSSGAVAGAALAVGLGAGRAAAAPLGAVGLPYPAQGLGAAGALEVGVPRPFSYPDAASPCTLLRLGRAVPGGVGPQGDIVAYSALCAHRGGPLRYDAAARTLKCPLHFSIFDPECGGQQVCGHATANLPRIVLEHDPADDSLRAVAVEGLLYGRQANLIGEASA